MKIPHWLKRSTRSEEYLDSASQWREMRDSNPDILVLEDNREKHGEDFIRVDHTANRYYRCSRFDFSVVSSEYQYRIEGTKVLARLIEKSEDSLGTGIQESVKDNVVLESEIPESALPSLREIEIVQCREEVEWHEPFPSIVKYFILSRHPELVSSFECRRFFRLELERIKTGTNALVKKAAETGAVLYEMPDGHYELRFSEDVEKSASPASDEHREAVHSLYETSLSACGISFNEFHDGKRLIRFLNAVLGEEQDVKATASG